METTSFLSNGAIRSNGTITLFVIPTRSGATRRNLGFPDGVSGAVPETQIPRAQTALGMTRAR